MSEEVPASPPTNGGLKDSIASPSGRKSILRGAKHSRGFVIRPEQMMALFHDTHPNLPIPKDAEHKGIGIEDAGINSKIQFYFESQTAPSEHCFELRPDIFFRMLVNLADGLLPWDSELEGIEVSRRFTVLLLRVKSSHWAPCPKDDMLPLVHLRYEFGKLLLVDPSRAIENERRIRIQ